MARPGRSSACNRVSPTDDKLKPVKCELPGMPLTAGFDNIIGVTAIVFLHEFLPPAVLRISTLHSIASRMSIPQPFVMNMCRSC